MRCTLRRRGPQSRPAVMDAAPSPRSPDRPRSDPRGGDDSDLRTETSEEQHGAAPDSDRTHDQSNVGRVKQRSPVARGPEPGVVAKTIRTVLLDHPFLAVRDEGEHGRADEPCDADTGGGVPPD